MPLPPPSVSERELRSLLALVEDAASRTVGRRRAARPRSGRQALEWLLDGEGLPCGAGARAARLLTLADAIRRGVPLPLDPRRGAELEALVLALEP